MEKESTSHVRAANILAVMKQQQKWLLWTDEAVA